MSGNLLLEREIRRGVGEVKTGVAGTRLRLGRLAGGDGRMSLRLDRIGACMDRVRRRLDLAA